MKDSLGKTYQFDFITKFKDDGSVKCNLSEAYVQKLLSKRRLLVARYWMIMKDTTSSIARKLLSIHAKRILLPAGDPLLLQSQDALCDLCPSHKFLPGIRFDARDNPHEIKICKSCLCWYPVAEPATSHEVGINRHIVNEIKREHRRIIEHINLVLSFQPKT